MPRVLEKPPMRIVHPDHGDMTADVYFELRKLIQEEHEAEMADIERAQQEIAAGTPGAAIIQKGFALKAQIDPRVHAYWRMREGPEFWKHELDWFLKRHPECGVRQKSAKPTVLVGGQPKQRGRVVGKRGRWAA